MFLHGILNLLRPVKERHALDIFTCENWKSLRRVSRYGSTSLCIYNSGVYREIWLIYTSKWSVENLRSMVGESSKSVDNFWSYERLYSEIDAKIIEIYSCRQGGFLRSFIAPVFVDRFEWFYVLLKGVIYHVFWCMKPYNPSANSRRLTSSENLLRNRTSKKKSWSRLVNFFPLNGRSNIWGHMATKAPSNQRFVR